MPRASETLPSSSRSTSQRVLRKSRESARIWLTLNSMSRSTVIGQHAQSVAGQAGDDGSTCLLRVILPTRNWYTPLDGCQCGPRDSFHPSTNGKKPASAG